MNLISLRAKSNYRLVLFIVFFYPSLYSFGIDWSWLLNESDGTFLSTEGDASTSLSGTFSRLGNGFIEMTVSGGSGASHPGNGVKFYPIEVPGFFLATPPVLSHETQMAYNVVSGSCPSQTIKFNWTFQGWSSTNNMTSNNQGAWGEFTWNNATQSATINSIYNVTNYGAPSWFSGAVPLTVDSCSGSLANVTHEAVGTDRSGSLYLSEEGGLVYRTDSNKLIVGVPQKKIQQAAIFYDSYTAYLADFDTGGSISDNIRPIRMSLGSAGTDGSGSSLSNVASSTTDGGFGSVSFTVNSINTPVDGMLQATLVRGANSGNLSCMVHFTSRTILFCSGQTHDANAMPSNLVLVSDTKKIGALDHSFGTDGVFARDFSAGGSFSGAQGITRNTDGGFIVFGNVYNQTDGNNNNIFVKFDSEGQLVTSYGTGGKVEVSVEGSGGVYEWVMGAGVHSDGSITFSGWFNTNDPYDAGTFDPFVARIDSSGNLSSSFGTGGIYTNSSSAGYEVNHAVAIDSEDRAVVAGIFRPNDWDAEDIIVMRFNSSGTLDSSFGSGGKFTASYDNGWGEAIETVLIDSNQKIVVAGWGFTTDGDDAQTVVRLNSDGSLDTGFGTGGNTYTLASIFPGQDWAELKECKEDSQQRIVCAGYGEPGGSNYDFVFLRLLSDGRLDTSFGTGGGTSYNHGGVDKVFSLEILEDDRVVVAGFREQLGTGGGVSIFGRFLTNGSLDTDFGTGGTGWIKMSPKTQGNSIQGLFVDNYGRVVVSGEENDVGDQPSFVIRRFWTP